MTPRGIATARLLVLLAWLGIALLLLLPTLSWLEPSALPVAGRGTHPIATRLAAWAAAMPPFIVLALGLGMLARFCRRLDARRPFTPAAAAALRAFGWSLIAASLLLLPSRLAVAAVLADDPLVSGVTAFAAPAPLLAVTLGTIFGLVFVLFAALLTEATRLAEENESFV
ncbi:MAG: DUF2975 domain-containing protein [Alphaproteobacteria bacterium]